MTEHLPSAGSWVRLPAAAQGGLLALAYLSAALLATALATTEDETVALWPSAGLAQWALIATPRRRWPALSLGVLAAAIAYALLRPEAPAEGAAIAAHVIGPVVGVVVLRWVLDDEPLDLSRVRDFVAMTVGTAAHLMAGAVAGVLLAQAAIGAVDAGRWLDWALAAAVGILLVLPLAAGIAGRGRPNLLCRRPWEGAGVIGAAALLALVAFGLTDLPLIAIVLLPVLWATLRLGLCGTALAMDVVTLIVLALTVTGRGMYAHEADSPDEAVVLAQSAVILVMLVATAVSSLTVERHVAREQLRRREEERRTTERLETLGMIASAVAHDFNNVLAVVRGHAERGLRRAGQGEDPRPELRKIMRGIDSGAGLARQLLSFSRVGPPRPGPIDLNHVVCGVQALLQRILPATIALEVDLDDDAGRVLADHTELEQLLLNLVMNARDATPGSGTITMRTQLLDGHVRLTVTDTGVGMDDTTRALAVKRGFTTKATGSGLGLSTVARICEEHGARLEITSAPAEGTSVSVEWQACEGPTLPQREVQPIDGGAETVLLAEDNAHVRALMRVALAEGGYDLLEATDGEQALTVAEEHRGPIDLLVSDITMPTVDGPELYRRLRQRRPGLRVLFVSGAAEDAPRSHGIAEDVLLGKPFGLVELANRVRSALDRPEDDPVWREVVRSHTSADAG